MKSLILGTRGSLLAKAQSQQVANALSAKTGIPVVLKIIKTRGDAIQDKPLAEIGGKGLFTLELEEALHDGTIDFAVHSLKDLPTDDPDGLMIGAIPKREDPRDALIGQLLGKIGTGSLRRRVQLTELNPNIELLPCRGNVDTRLSKLDKGMYNGIVLAMAGLNRLNIVRSDIKPLSLLESVPACGQGALGLQCRDDRMELRQQLLLIHDTLTAMSVKEERLFLHGLGGGCHIAAACHVWFDERINDFRGLAMCFDEQHNKVNKAELSGEKLGLRLLSAVRPS